MTMLTETVRAATLMFPICQGLSSWQQQGFHSAQLMSDLLPL